MEKNSGPRRGGHAQYEAGNSAATAGAKIVIEEDGRDSVSRFLTFSLDGGKPGFDPNFVQWGVEVPYIFNHL